MTATFASCCDGRGQFGGWGRRPATRRVDDIDEAFALLQPRYGRFGCMGLPASRPIPSIVRPRNVDAHDVIQGNCSSSSSSTATKARPHAGPPPIPAVQDGDDGVPRTPCNATCRSGTMKRWMSGAAGARGLADRQGAAARKDQDKNFRLTTVARAPPARRAYRTLRGDRRGRGFALT